MLIINHVAESIDKGQVFEIKRQGVVTKQQALSDQRQPGHLRQITRTGDSNDPDSMIRITTSQPGSAPGDPWINLWTALLLTE